MLSTSARLRLWHVAALVAGEALRTCTLVSTPYHWTFQILWVLYWLTICLLVTTTTWLLAIQPVRSAKKAAKVGPPTLAFCCCSTLHARAIGHDQPKHREDKGRWCTCSGVILHGVFPSAPWLAAQGSRCRLAHAWEVLSTWAVPNSQCKMGG